jgi:TonB-linked SusC/RagA family outer membrane protein
LDQNGIIIESNFKRAGLKFNLDQNVSRRIKIGVNINANRTVNDAVPSDGTGYQNDSPLWNALVTTPAIPITDQYGNYVNNQDEGIEKILENPVSIAKTRRDITYTTRVLSSAFTDIEILKGLTFRANFGADISNSKRNVYIPNTAKTQALPNLGVASIGSVQSLNWLTEYTLSYKKDFSIDHRLTALVGYTAQATQLESVFSRTDNFSTNKFEFNNLGAGSDPRPSESNAIKAGLLSYIGRLNYTYKDKYIFTGTVRRDGSSKFGTLNKWGIFPSAGLAWRLSEEKYLKNVDFLSNLKLRSSYGLTGNQDIGSYSSLALYNTVRPIIGGSPVIGFYPNRIPNSNLKWEKTAQFNIGMDAAFWDGKFNFSADYYIKTTKDLLLDVTIPNQSGYGSSVQNIGAVENKGFEFSLGFNHSFGEIAWNSTFNISFNRNKLVSLPEGTDRLLFAIGRGESAVGGQSIAIPGKPLGLFYGYHFLGIWQTKEEIIAAGNIVGGVNQPGLAKYEDLNGDGFRQNDTDRKILGDPNPDFTYGFSNDFTYKNFKLSIFINGSYGNKIANLNRIGLLTQPQKHNVLKIYYDQHWTGPGTGNTIETPLSNAGEWKNFSDRDIEDGSYLRVKTISLSYNLPKKFLNINWIGNAQVYVAGENLITLTNYSGFDPEVDLYSSSNVQMGVDNGAYPASKSVRIGLKLGF